MPAHPVANRAPVPSRHASAADALNPLGHDLTAKCAEAAAVPALSRSCREASESCGPRRHRPLLPPTPRWSPFPSHTPQPSAAAAAAAAGGRRAPRPGRRSAARSLRGWVRCAFVAHRERRVGGPAVGKSWNGLGHGGPAAGQRAGRRHEAQARTPSKCDRAVTMRPPPTCKMCLAPPGL
eukprot:scaffold4372_cov397-Prasinococcus_capsulatus_cf.AAC.22